MASQRLNSLTIENFRSLRGKVVIPLHAQVILVHGTNGMGKTSVLSALELGLTGKISHLAAPGDPYKSYLATLGTDGGSINLTTTTGQGDVGHGSLTFGNGVFEDKPLLQSADARFFSERCYLPQATLGRLLEIYNTQASSATSPLTLFVKELLGLDPLDALVDGLNAAHHVARLRNLVPAQRRLETLRDSIEEDIGRLDEQRTALQRETQDRERDVRESIAGLRGEVAQAEAPFDSEAIRVELQADRSLEQELSDRIRQVAELRSLEERWKSLPADDASRDIASHERHAQACAGALRHWREGPGAKLDTVVATVRAVFADVPLVDDGPETSHAEAKRRAASESARCIQLTTRSAAAQARITDLDTTIERSTKRIKEINDALAVAANDAAALSSALAGVMPHVRGDHCPVCDRDFAQVGGEPLSVHIAAKIATLTNEAGRLQGLATERAEEADRLASAQRERLGASSNLLSAEENAAMTSRATQMSEAAEQLESLGEVVRMWTHLIDEAAKAHEAVAQLRRRDESSQSLLPAIEVHLVRSGGRSISTYPSVEAAIEEAERLSGERVVVAEKRLKNRVAVLSQLDLHAKDVKTASKLQADQQALKKRQATVLAAEKAASQRRDTAKKIAAAADRTRSEIVKTVFNTSLNRVWRDLFVRLAPSEQFVPAFKLPSTDGGKVEAVLETLYRSGTPSGSPGAMLSQGNLNTAALTLFLALHLSVPVRFPWLILDDPVQSMDDVHTAQFAALLRTLSKSMDRQLVVAVHERALFDYLTLELSPAFPGDSLITVEISRNFQGDAVATPRAFGYEETFPIAA
ncbi:AAA family ATPase [Pseudorhodoferax sp. Leaf267]|uniref:AAA family ATPase n=1 Tax=Pseudorhodoferax sp. Leaf267 TaxID=1736316 RepID=UPI00070189C6|nr:AAA family ATPase [Pseudorhodoferax sp. Leaf267]KQP23352.1 hypothetical protein ASF43_05685 [Pseudorhodoferax sp. Leaf267]